MTRLSEEVRAAARAVVKFEELHALIQRDPAALLAKVVHDSDLHDDATAWFLLKHLERFYAYISPHAAAMLAEAAVVACAGTEDPVILVRAWKAKANILRFAANFAEAEVWLVNAVDLVKRTVTVDADSHLAIIGRAQAMVAWDQRCTERAVGMLSVARAKFLSIGDDESAREVAEFCADIGIRLRQFDDARGYLEPALRAAIQRSDEVGIARAHAALAECWLGMKDFALARWHVDRALDVCRTHSMEWAEVRIACTAALISMGIEGISVGRARLEEARTRCKDFGLPGQAVRCLVYGVETISEVLGQDDSPELELMCRTIQIEASALNLPVDVSEATARLRAAATRRAISLADLELVLAHVSAGAKYAVETVN